MGPCENSGRANLRTLYGSRGSLDLRGKCHGRSDILSCSGFIEEGNKCKQCYEYHLITSTRTLILRPRPCAPKRARPKTNTTPRRASHPANVVRRRHAPRRAHATDTVEPAAPLHHLVKPRLLVHIGTHPHTASAAEEAARSPVEMALVERLACLRVSAPLEPVSLSCAVDGVADVGAGEGQTEEDKLD